MAGPAESVALVGSETRHSVLDGVDKSAVLRELENILGSPSFRSSGRSKQFLSYVVLHKLDGHHELLKERGIGGGAPRSATKNMQVVVQTTVIDSVAGAPHVVAAYFW